MRIKLTAEGGPETAAALKQIRAAVASRVLKAAVAKQARKAAKVAKSRVRSRRSGQLGRSIGMVFRSYKNRTVWVYVVGPRKGFRVQISALPKGSQRRLLRLLGKRKRRRLTDAQTTRLVARWVDPIHYAHLVEGGRKATAPKKKRVMSDGVTVIGRRAAAVAPDPFMAPAAAAVQGASAEIAADVLSGITREAAKAAAKGKTILRA